MTILAILNELANEPSTNAKVAILQREKNNELLKRVFQAAYNPMITYGIKQIPSYTSSGKSFTLLDALGELNQFVTRKVTGNDAVNCLKALLSDLPCEDAIVLTRIIQRDLRCNTSDTLAARVWPGLVPTFDVMLSHKDISGIKFPAYAQIKSDGSRCHMSLQAGKAVAFSRNGKPIELHGMFDEALVNMVKEGETVDGELLAVDVNGKVLDRKTGNGIVTKAVKGTISREEADRLILVSWDIVDFTSTIPYKERIERLSNVVWSDKIRVLDTHIVNNKEEAETFFQECLMAGQEGAMIKNMSAVWQPKRTKDLGKMKAEEEADLVVVALEEGTGKNEGRLGALVCQTADGLLEVGVGTGFSDDLRTLLWSKDMIGKIITVRYNQKIQDKNKDKQSLFLPRFVCVRADKDAANTVDELK